MYSVGFANVCWHFANVCSVIQNVSRANTCTIHAVLNLDFAWDLELVDVILLNARYLPTAVSGAKHKHTHSMFCVNRVWELGLSFQENKVSPSIVQLVGCKEGNSVQEMKEQVENAAKGETE